MAVVLLSNRYRNKEVTGMSGRTYHVDYPDEVQFSIPDDIWVAEAYSGLVAYFHNEGCKKPYETHDTTLEVVGATAEKMLLFKSRNLGPAYYDPESGTLRHPVFSSETYRWLYFSRRPFGVIGTPIKNGEPDGDRRHFTVARQIHKGELGRKVPVHLPQVVQTIRDPEVDEGRGGQKTWGWVRLDQLTYKLAAVAGIVYGDSELLQAFAGFNDIFREGFFTVLIATEPEDFQGRIVHFPQLQRLRVDEAIQAACRYPGWLWVRASWAANVMRLCSLGYQPETEQATA